jgi:hypothetical protein
MACLNRMFARIAANRGWALLALILVSAAAPMYAQSIRPRMRGGADREQPDPSAASTQPAAQPVPAQPAAAPPAPAQPAPSQPQAAPPVNQVAPSARERPAMCLPTCSMELPTTWS